MRDEIAVLRHTVVGRENPGVRRPGAQAEDIRPGKQAQALDALVR